MKIYKESILKKTQNKLRKFLNKSHIEILESVYTLQVTDNKRKLIYDENNEVHSVFSGIERNSLSWNEVEKIANGFTIIKNSSVRFFKNFISLNITIKNSLETSIVFNPRKKVNNNLYKPLKINNNILMTFNYYLKIIKYRITYLINKYNLNKLK